ncbi:unnamed protein product [Durusdinium trenchii]|uniref:Uncharacterized protein n=1 Tax=Durusdinium trenchii TaxID=1381693 RepID=A0ABP0SSY2_9DINO
MVSFVFVVNFRKLETCAKQVVALIESRSREVGLAGVCCRSMEFELTQFSDTTSYSRTTSAVLAADPSAVLVSGKRSHL